MTVLIDVWVRCAQKGEHGPKTLVRDWERRLLEGLDDSFHLSQIEWMIKRYFEHVSMYPSITDFVKDFVPSLPEVPEGVVAAAFNSGVNELVDLAEEYETLRGAWFESEDTVEKANAIEAKLTAALM